MMSKQSTLSAINWWTNGQMVEVYFDFALSRHHCPGPGRRTIIAQQLPTKSISLWKRRIVSLNPLQSYVNIVEMSRRVAAVFTGIK